MKMTFNIRTAALAALVLTGASSCTKNFKDYNTDPAALSAEQTLSNLPSAFGVMAQNIYHNYQTAQNLSADGFAGYFMSPTFFQEIYDLDYGLHDSWDRNGFVDMYSYVMYPVSQFRAYNIPTLHPDAYAAALILQVDGMDRVTDRFGPIPYSKAGTSVTAVGYDSQQQVYNEFFAQLDTAVSLLTTYIASNSGTGWLGAQDMVYAGKNQEWLKFANSLRLRLAMRIVKVDPTTAQAQAEKALADPGGVMTTVSDDAFFAQSGGRNNDVWTVASSYGDCRMNAALMTYMNGYSDARLKYYAQPSTNALSYGQYEGIRIGTIPTKAVYGNYAGPNTDSANAAFAKTAPQPLMTAAEVWFLKAEAAVRGWTGSGDAQTDYETGITVSHQQWGATMRSGYLTDATSTETAYNDPEDTTSAHLFESPALSTMTIAWDNSAANETKLERIITQKWIAVYPDGQEAWADYRRTGYPKLFPVVYNLSGGLISTSIQIRRLAYPQTEYQTNAAAVAEAVQMLGGADNGGTRLWWDTGGSNF